MHYLRLPLQPAVTGRYMRLMLPRGRSRRLPAPGQEPVPHLCDDLAAPDAAAAAAGGASLGLARKRLHCARPESRLAPNVLRRIATLRCTSLGELSRESGTHCRVGSPGMHRGRHLVAGVLAERDGGVCHHRPPLLDHQVIMQCFVETRVLDPSSDILHSAQPECVADAHTGPTSIIHNLSYTQAHPNTTHSSCNPALPL